MDVKQIYISTIDEHAGDIARENGFGIEIAEYCIPWNLDDDCVAADARVRRAVDGVPELILHAPYSELSPAAVDPMVRRVTEKRYEQSFAAALRYGCKKIVIHSGYTSHMYYKCWYEEQAVKFWKDFIKRVPDGLLIVLENVLEDDPDLLINVVREVDDPRFKLCVDIGHVNASIGFEGIVGKNRIGESTVNCKDVYEWITRSAPFISHYHIHNNAGFHDTHNHLYDGTIDMKKMLSLIDELTPNATCTLELSDARSSVDWMKGEKII